MDRALLFLPLLLYFLAILWITWRTGRRQSGADHDYFLANRNIGVFFSLVSVVATETSVATTIVFPEAGFKHGFALIWLCAGFIAGRLIVAEYFLPELYRRHRISMYATVTGDSIGARRALSFSYLAAKIVSSSVRFFLGGFALAQLFGGPIWLWILVMGLVAGIYSMVGGLHAVVFTDQIQGWVLLSGGLIVIGVVATSLDFSAIAVPSFGSFAPSWTETSFAPTLFLGALVLSLGTHGADQDMLQRVLATRTLPEAQRALRLSGLGAAIVILIYIGCGWLLSQAAPTGVGEKAPLLDFVRHHGNPLAIGGFAVVLMAAAMSTLDSALHSTAAVWKSALNEKIPARYYSALSLVLLMGAAMAFIYLQQFARSFLDLAMNSFNYINGGLIGVFTVFVLRGRTVPLTAIVAAVLAGFTATTFANLALDPRPAWTIVTMASAAAATAAAWLASARRFNPESRP